MRIPKHINLEFNANFNCALRCVCMAAGAFFVASTSISAATVGYWRFDGDTGAVAGADISSALDSSLNSNSATQWTSNENAAQYSSNVGGAYIYDPVANSFAANTLSMLSPAGVLTSDDSQLIVSGASDFVTGNDWTFEMFVKTPTSLGSTGTRIGNFDGNERWNLNAGSNNIQFRVDTSAASGDVAQVYQYGDPTEDGEWHHLGMTVSYDGSTSTTIELFVDYVSAGTAVADGQFLPNGDLRFGRDSGSNGDEDWLFDEVRVSDSILTSGQFLQYSAVPEPSTLALLSGCCALVTVMMRRRKLK